MRMTGYRTYYNRPDITARHIVLSSHARGDNAPAVPMLCASPRQRRLRHVRLILRRQG